MVLSVERDRHTENVFHIKTADRQEERVRLKLLFFFILHLFELAARTNQKIIVLVSETKNDLAYCV